MNKAQLCRHMADYFRKSGRPLNRNDAREFLEELRRLCLRELADVGQFSIPKIAKLVVETRRQRQGRDPTTGESITIPARRVVRVRVSSSVQDVVENREGKAGECARANSPPSEDHSGRRRQLSYRR